MIQREIPIMGEVPEIRELPASLVAHCQSYQDAVKLCMSQDLAGRSQAAWADLLGMHESSLSVILNPKKDHKRKRNLDPSLFEVIQEAAGNAAIDQFFTMQRKGLLYHQSKQLRIAQLKEELEQLEATA